MLKEVNAQHHKHPKWRAASLALRVVRLNQLRPGNHSIHFVQELALASAFGRQVQSKGGLFHLVRTLQWVLALTSEDLKIWTYADFP